MANVQPPSTNPAYRDRVAPRAPKKTVKPPAPVGPPRNSPLVKGTKPAPASPGTTRSSFPTPANQPVDIRGIRSFLLAKGYQIPVNNKNDRTFRSALADWLQPNELHPLSSNLQALLHASNSSITGKRNPAKWNMALGTNKSVVFKPNNKLLDQSGSLVDPVAPKQQTLPNANTISVPTGAPMDEADASKGYTPLDMSYADKLAGSEFDQQIRQAMLAQALQKAQAPQNQHDISHWYDQVLKSAATAGTRDTAASKSAHDEVSNAAAAILASLGGSASDAAGAVGAAGTAATGTVDALGATQDQYNNDVQPILQNEKAGQMSSQRARDEQMAAQLASQLLGLQGQKGASRASHAFDIVKYNNDQQAGQASRLMQIRQYNNSLTQQTFSNKLAQNAQNIAAVTAGARLASAIGKSNKPAKWSFGMLSSKDRADIRDSWAARAQSLIKAGKSPADVAVDMGNLVRSQGWTFNTPGVKDFTYRVLRIAGITPDPRWYK